MKNIILSALIAALVSFAVVSFSPQAADTKVETVYDRVMRTKTLRCGYNLEPPMLSLDANTGKIQGATADIVERMGNLLGLKVEWAERVGWTEMKEGLLANRYDLACNGKWIFASQTQGAQFTQALYFTPVFAYGRMDESRLDDSLSQLNDPKFTVTSQDGEVNYFIARDVFPKAKRVELPALTDPSQLIQNVLSKKADVTFLPAYLANDYMAKKPGEIKQLTSKPVAVFDTALMFKAGEAAFAGTLESALRELQSSGFIDGTLRKHGVSPATALRAADPYKLP